MAKFIVMGNYTAQAFKGFIGNPDQDRAAAATALSEAVGGKMESFMITRGAYDFVGVVSGSIGFEGAAAVKLAVEASGAITNFTILEEMDMGKAAGMPAALPISISSNMVKFVIAPEASTASLTAAAPSNPILPLTTPTKS